MRNKVHCPIIWIISERTFFVDKDENRVTLVIRSSSRSPDIIAQLQHCIHACLLHGFEYLCNYAIRPWKLSIFSFLVAFSISNFKMGDSRDRFIEISSWGNLALIAFEQFGTVSLPYFPSRLLPWFLVHSQWLKSLALILLLNT